MAGMVVFGFTFPAIAPNRNIRPSIFPVIAPITQVPGHHPPMTKPAPMIRPPIAIGTMKVGLR